ncbi:MAG: type II and III secretion system protein family protein, partial [Gammaproteobacteria bacterium]
ILFSTVSQAATLKLNDKYNKRVEVALNKSTVLQLNTPVKKISIGNPAIADILVLRGSQVYVLGKGLGSTNVLLWDKNDGVISNLDVEVTHDLAGLKAQLYELMPGEEVNVYSSQKSIVLNGLVSSVTKMDAVLRIAESFTGTRLSTKEKKGGASTGGVINLMQVGGAQQVMLEVKVSEVSRSILEQFGIKFDAINAGSNGIGGIIGRGATLGGGAAPIFTTPAAVGPAVTSVLSDSASISRGIFGAFLDGDMLYNFILNAAKQDGIAKVLAEPTLTTLSGQPATFLSGGEFPVPVPGQNGQVTIEYKDFGIELGFLPVVLDARQINLKLNVSVSELTTDQAVAVDVSNASSNIFVPALRKRSASSTVELADGQTIAIAGLISENTKERVNKIPGLGDIPILGALFRSKEFVKGQSELVILVTPHLAKPIDEKDVRMPTDRIVDPDRWGFYLMGGLTGIADPDRSSTVVAEGSASGKYGHQVDVDDDQSSTKQKLSPPSSSETEFREHINQLKDSSYE